jgi:hypothetical protein
MFRPAAVLAALAASAALAGGPAAEAHFTGGHDETHEDLAAHFVMCACHPEPHVQGAAPGGTHLLVREIVVAGAAGAEFIEVWNPTLSPVALDEVHLSNHRESGTGFFRIAEAGYAVSPGAGFTARFPAGATLAPGAVCVVAVRGTQFYSRYLQIADYELIPGCPFAPDMVRVGATAPLADAVLDDAHGFVALFRWDGASDLVCDEDYVCWGAGGALGRVDRTGVSVDGPDLDAIPTVYRDDTPAAEQHACAAPPAGSGLHRTDAPEAGEAGPGNGCLDGVVAARAPTWGALKARYR